MEERKAALRGSKTEENLKAAFASEPRPASVICALLRKPT
jgi:hypothetical protein